MEYWHFILIFFTGCFGGMFGALIGGGSLLTIPALIFIGLPPHIAVASNRFGLLGMVIFGGLKFHEQKMINYRRGLIMGIAACIGAVIGAQLLMVINEHMLERVVALLTLALVCLLFFKPSDGLTAKNVTATPQHSIITVSVSFLLGIYGGFYGACVATFFSYFLIFVCGETFLQSAATRKIPMFLLSLIATIIFITHRVVHFPYAVTLFIGMAIGAYIGVHYAQRLGNVWMRRFFCALTIMMALKLLV